MVCHDKTPSLLQANTAAKHWPGYQTHSDPQLIPTDVKFLGFDAEKREVTAIL